MKSNRDSEIKARYALAVLGVAQVADRETAARLVRGLAKDFPHPDEKREVASLRSHRGIRKIGRGPSCLCGGAVFLESSYRSSVQMARRSGKKLIIRARFLLSPLVTGLDAARQIAICLAIAAQQAQPLPRGPSR
jgi:hypothetical protein